MRRRPEPVTVNAPLRLLRFVADEWDVPPVKEHATEWEAERWSVLGPFYAWRQARAVWTAAHGDALGNPLEPLQFERQQRLAYYSTIKELPNG